MSDLNKVAESNNGTLYDSNGCLQLRPTPKRSAYVTRFKKRSQRCFQSLS
jgi:hypothetical protein